MKKSWFFLPVFLLLIGLFYEGCGEVTPVWRSEISLQKEYSLHYTLPRDTTFTFKHRAPEVPLRLELAITYDVSDIARPSLPIRVFLERINPPETASPREFELNIPLQNEGEWLGYPEGNDVDYTVTTTVSDDLMLQSEATYSLKIFGDDETQETILGIVKIVARLYENEVPETIDNE